MMTGFPTAKERIAIYLILEWLKESPFNRSWDEYVAIAKRIPKLDACHEYINGRLREIKESGSAPYKICYRKAGDIGHWYEEYPESLSKETIRRALVKSGYRALRNQKPVTC